MSDLMILMPKWRVAVEAKYTEVKDENYKPLVEEWLKDNPENRQKVLAGWKHYIGDRMTNDEKIINVTPINCFTASLLLVPTQNVRRA